MAGLTDTQPAPIQGGIDAERLEPFLACNEDLVGGESLLAGQSL